MLICARSAELHAVRSGAEGRARGYSTIPTSCAQIGSAYIRGGGKDSGRVPTSTYPVYWVRT